MPSSGIPSVTSTISRRVGSRTTTTFGDSTGSCLVIGSSDILVNPRIGAPRRSGPYSGKPCPYLPALIAAEARNVAAVLAPWPPRPCHLISMNSPIISPPKICEKYLTKLIIVNSKSTENLVKKFCLTFEVDIP